MPVHGGLAVLQRKASAFNTALAALGMVQAFTDAADFSGIAAPGAAALKISAVLHNACVAVNEEGTEAAAATGLVMRNAR